MDVFYFRWLGVKSKILCGSGVFLGLGKSPGRMRVRSSGRLTFQGILKLELNQVQTPGSPFLSCVTMVKESTSLGLGFFICQYFSGLRDGMGDSLGSMRFEARTCAGTTREKKYFSFEVAELAGRVPGAAGAILVTLGESLPESEANTE